MSPQHIPKRQLQNALDSCKGIVKMGLVILLVFPFMLMAEILKRNK